MGNRNYPFKEILVIKLDEIGDLVTALPIFYNIHKQYPEAQITLLCKPFNAIFFKNINYVNCIHEIDILNNSINYDLILDLRGNKQTLKYALTSKPKYRLDRGSIRFKNKFLGGQKNEIDTNLEVISPLIDEEMPIVVIATRKDNYEKVVSNIQEVKARGGKLIAIVTEGDVEVKSIADHCIEIPKCFRELSPLLTIIPLQLLSYHIALMRNCNVDQPRNLAKSVTVE